MEPQLPGRNQRSPDRLNRPKNKMINPEPRLTQTIFCGVTRSFSRLTLPDNSSHHSSEPENTPATNMADDA